ncbi:MAG TPA: hypothetical protein VLA64_13065, partial [Azonexus sp.]|nr:hypothetical protein [Azonexus sp.]
VVPLTVREHPCRPRILPATLLVRLAGDRRNEAEREGFASRERRRRPERRIPEVGETSFEEFERWKNQLGSR